MIELEKSTWRLELSVGFRKYRRILCVDLSARVLLGVPDKLGYTVSREAACTILGRAGQVTRVRAAKFQLAPQIVGLYSTNHNLLLAGMQHSKSSAKRYHR